MQRAVKALPESPRLKAAALDLAMTHPPSNVEQKEPFCSDLCDSSQKKLDNQVISKLKEEHDKELFSSELCEQT